MGFIIADILRKLEKKYNNRGEKTAGVKLLQLI
jgi:hypothetical protein